MLSFVGVSAEHSLRLKALAEVGCAVSIVRETDTMERCIIESHGRRVIGQGTSADAAAADALERWEESS
jgi:hypothetical protein